MIPLLQSAETDPKVISIPKRNRRKLDFISERFYGNKKKGKSEKRDDEKRKGEGERWKPGDNENRVSDFFGFSFSFSLFGWKFVSF